MLYPKPCYNELCYKKVVVYIHLQSNTSDVTSQNVSLGICRQQRPRSARAPPVLLFSVKTRGNIINRHIFVQIVFPFLARLHIAVISESDCRSRVHKFESNLCLIIFVEINHKIISMVIPLLLIQEGQLSVTGSQILGFWRKNVHNTG